MTYTRTLVSKNGLSFIRLVAAECETRRQRSTQSAESRKGVVLAPISPHLEFALTGDSDFDLVTLFQIERLDDC
jgi:hypothetical protein